MGRPLDAESAREQPRRGDEREPDAHETAPDALAPRAAARRESRRSRLLRRLLDGVEVEPLERVAARVAAELARVDAVLSEVEEHGATATPPARRERAERPEDGGPVLDVASEDTERHLLLPDTLLALEDVLRGLHEAPRHLQVDVGDAGRVDAMVRIALGRDPDGEVEALARDHRGAGRPRREARLDGVEEALAPRDEDRVRPGAPRCRAEIDLGRRRVLGRPRRSRSRRARRVDVNDRAGGRSHGALDLGLTSLDLAHLLLGEDPLLDQEGPELLGIGRHGRERALVRGLPEHPERVERLGRLGSAGRDRLHEVLAGESTVGDRPRGATVLVLDRVLRPWPRREELLERHDARVERTRAPLAPLEAGLEDLVHLARRVLGEVARDLAALGELARDRLEEEDAPRVDVAPLVGGLAAHHLGGEVTERALHLGARGRELERARDLDVPARPLEDAAEAEVRETDTAVLARLDEDVPRLHVAVDDAALVRVLQGAAGLDEDPGGPLPVERSFALDRLGERHAVHVLEDDVGRIVRDRDLERLHDRRVIESCLDHALEPQRRERLQVPRDLDRDDSPEDLVLGAEHLAEPALADLLEDPIIEKAVTRRELPDLHGTSPHLCPFSFATPVRRLASTWMDDKGARDHAV